MAWPLRPAPSSTTATGLPAYGTVVKTSTCANGRSKRASVPWGSRGGRSIGEIQRVLRPGGQLRFFEHVRADTPGLARVQRILDATVWPTFVGGCHPARDTRAAIEGAGFTIDHIDQVRIPETRIPAPASPHILGVAIAPAAPEG
jgi:hypothetical protein